MAKAPSISLTKLIEATKLQPRTGLPLGQPPVTIPYGGLVEPVSVERDRQRFKYLGELFECQLELFLSATGSAASAPEETPAPVEAPAHTAAAVPEKAPEAAVVSGPRLEWERLNSSEPGARRASIPGGWLVALSTGLTFVPDAKHQWKGGSGK